MSPLLLLLAALFLFPLAVYCMFLGMINRRPKPFMVAGTWDFVGVLLATSGFLLFGPLMLNIIFGPNLRYLPFQRGSPSLASVIAEAWSDLWYVYYLMVLAGAAFLTWTRSQTTVIYNIDLQTLKGVLAQTAAQLGLDMEQNGNRVSFGAGHSSTPLPESGITTESEIAGLSNHERIASPVAALDLDEFPFFNNISLHWQSTAPTPRANLERQLRQALARVLSPDHPIGAWLFGVSALLYLLIMMATGMFVAITMFTGRG